LGIDQWRQDEWRTAKEHLQEAANRCPVPDHPIPPVTVAVFFTYQYMPFYYLGDSYYNLDDFPNALRNFYLSSWRREPERAEKEATEDLAAHTASCKRRFDRAGVGERNSYFSNGQKLASEPDWEKAAENMWDALQVEQESGETTNASGRWPDPYLPRFWLARALAELRCYQLACDQLGRSLLNKLSTKAVKDERKKMEELRLECVSRRGDQGTSELCQRWQCWLKQGGLQSP